MGRGPLILWDVVEEHLDEAEFLFSQWEAGLSSPDYTLEEVEHRLEERLFAQIDGLVAAGAPASGKLLVPALSAEQASRVSAAALALLSAEGSAGVDAVLGALLGASPEAQGALVRALGLADRDDLSTALLSRLGAEAPAAALSALAFRSVDPGRSLAKIGADDAPELVVAGLRAGRVARARPLLQLAGELIASPDPALRDEAILTGLFLGYPAAWATVRKLVIDADPTSTRLLLLLALGGDGRDQQALIDALGAPGLRGAAIEALGYSGRMSGAEACLPLLHDDATAKLAGEAFVAITGAPLEALRLGAEEPSEAIEPIPLAEEALDHRAIPPPEAPLPLLDAGKVEAWWGEHRSRFDRQTRYLGGAPLRAEAALSALREGPMRRRHALGLEIAIRSRGRSKVETRAFARRQWSEIEKLGDLGEIDFARPFE